MTDNMKIVDFFDALYHYRTLMLFLRFRIMVENNYYLQPYR